MSAFKKYKNVKEFIIDLINHEGLELGDRYGRFWIYENYKFMYKDIGHDKWQKGLLCLHLYGTGIRIDSNQTTNKQSNGER